MVLLKAKDLEEIKKRKNLLDETPQNLENVLRIWSTLVSINIMVIREKIVVGTPILGYASIMAVVLFGFGAIFIMLSILGEYIWRALEESRKRPPFIIDVVKKHGDDGEE